MDSTTAPSPAVTLSYQEQEATAEGVFVYRLMAGGEMPSLPFRSAVFTVAPGCCSPEDKHKVSEIWIVTEGSGELRHQGRALRLETGHAVFFAPWETHQVRNDGPQTFKALAFWW